VQRADDADSAKVTPLLDAVSNFALAMLKSPAGADGNLAEQVGGLLKALTPLRGATLQSGSEDARAAKGVIDALETKLLQVGSFWPRERTTSSGATFELISRLRISLRLRAQKCGAKHVAVPGVVRGGFCADCFLRRGPQGGAASFFHPVLLVCSCNERAGVVRGAPPGTPSSASRDARVR
jgi:hypothetical protein